MRDGVYRVTVQPNHMAPIKIPEACVELTGTVLVTELSGLDSSAYFAIGDDIWVSLAHVVRNDDLGAAQPFYFEPSKCFYLGIDGKTVVGINKEVSSLNCGTVI